MERLGRGTDNKTFGVCSLESTSDWQRIETRISAKVGPRNSRRFRKF